MSYLILKKLRNFAVIYFIALLSSVKGVAVPSVLLEQKCTELKGELVNNWTCPASGEVRGSDMCRVFDENKVPMYFDGCSGSFDDYGNVFFKACVQHDLCYHHEPASHGLTKFDCDSEFYYNMEKICKAERPGDYPCINAAQAFYSAVAVFGATSWMCSKEKANYPRSQLLELILGLRDEALF